MNYFERFEYIEGYLMTLSKDYLQEKKLKKELEKQRKDIEALQKKLAGQEKELSSYKEENDGFDEKRFLDLKRKVERIDNVNLGKMEIQMRNLRYKIDAFKNQSEIKEVTHGSGKTKTRTAK